MFINSTFFGFRGEFKFKCEYGKNNNKPYFEIEHDEHNDAVFLHHALYPLSRIEEREKEVWLWFESEIIQLIPENEKDEKEIEKMKKHLNEFVLKNKRR